MQCPRPSPSRPQRAPCSHDRRAGSDDHTLKLWNVNAWLKSKVPSKFNDLTPICIYRGHTGPVTDCCLLNEVVVCMIAMSGEVGFSTFGGGSKERPKTGEGGFGKGLN